MRKILIILLIIMSMRITCFSSTISTAIAKDSTVSVKISDLKYANLIFIEHKKLRSDNLLLSKQINNLNKVNNQLTKIDSIRKYQITEFKKIHQSDLNTIDRLNKKLDKKNNTLKFWKIGGITITLGLILFIICR